MAYALGPVKPHVRAAAEEVGRRFGVRTVGGFASRSYASDHPLGLALDFMVSPAQGDALAAYVQANANRLGVTYIIWRQRIWSVDRSGEGWRGMEDRGSATANHMDHVHVSFSASGAGSGAVNVLGPDLLRPPGWGWQDDALRGATGVTEFITMLTSGSTWIRVAMFVAGLVLTLIALGVAGRASAAVARTTRKVT